MNLYSEGMKIESSVKLLMLGVYILMACTIGIVNMLSPNSSAIWNDQMIVQNADTVNVSSQMELALVTYE